MGGILLGGSLAYLLGPLVSEHLADVWGLQGWVWVTSGTGVVGAVFLIPAVFIVPDVPMQSPAGGAKKVGMKSKKSSSRKNICFLSHFPSALTKQR